MMRWVHAAVLATLGVGLAQACGGGGGGSGPSSPAPSPAPPQNPCPPSVEAPSLVEGPSPAPPSDKQRGVPFGDTGWGLVDLVGTHRVGLARGLVLPPSPFAAAAEDVGEIAVLADEGDLVLKPNTFDLRNAGLRFRPNAQGGYDILSAEAAFRPNLGSPVTLGDDDSVETAIPFRFAFYGREQVLAFVNSDGNLTFGEEDRASTPRNLSRLLTGPPRAAPFLADLDPSAGGRVFVRAASDELTVTWCGVRGFESQRSVTTQMTLLPDGTIELRFGDVSLPDAIVGLSPGRTGQFTPVDLSAAAGAATGPAAVGERFSLRGELDLVAVARKFYRTHPDLYDQLVIWADTIQTVSAFAFEVTVANEVRGLGIPVFESSRDLGSGGRLRSLVLMDWLGKYPDDPAEKFLGENTTLSVLGQEVGHRWLAFLRFRDHTGRVSEALLGRDRAHWSFFLDSDASVMEGNDIEDRGGGSFRTVAAVERYSALDQYAMGARSEAEVPPFFYVESPANVTPFKRRESAPQVGVTFNGTRRDVLIQDVVAVMGPREPPAGAAPRVVRQAFIYVVSEGRVAEPAQVEKLDRIRRAWEPFFARATEGRLRAETRLGAS